ASRFSQRDLSESRNAPGENPSTRLDTPDASPPLVARAAVLATFIALLVHTMAYAGFYEDPITWVLLAVGASLATLPTVRPSA
ncbi:MAG TPA: hypothetical protein VFM94_06460, partial [Solirubrobacterales bacterium]|nr:hypothetical protein [Solirubrobacterales bacterium]